jgi:hypothetical protein
MSKLEDRNFVDRCIRDDKGSVTIFQKPNLPLSLWIASTIITKLTHGAVQDFFGIVAFGALFTWAWLELFMGANYLRRILGFTILALSIYSRLKH